MTAVTALALFGVAAAEPASPADLWRAGRKVPRAGWRGDGLVEASAVLNAHLLNSKHSRSVRPCEELSLAEVHGAIAALSDLGDGGLRDVYLRAADNRRHVLDADRRRREASLARQNEATAALLRNGACHNAVMVWAHHLTEDGRAAAAALNITLPLLPLTDHRSSIPDGVPREAGESYVQMVSCAECHGRDNGTEETWPNWPNRMRITALTHGQWPFWCQHQQPGGRGPIDWSCNLHDFSRTYKRVTTHRNDAKGFYHTVEHEKCNLTAWGVSGEPDCVHQWADGLNASYVYTTDRKFCCAATQLEGLTNVFPAEVFMKSPNVTVFDSYATEFFDGPATRYNLPAGFPPGKNNFWYVQSHDGLPVEFGEGCHVGHNASECTGQQHAITYWSYNQSSIEVFGVDELPPRAADVPAACFQAGVTVCSIGPFHL